MFAWRGKPGVAVEGKAITPEAKKQVNALYPYCFMFELEDRGLDPSDLSGDNSPRKTIVIDGIIGSQNSLGWLRNTGIEPVIIGGSSVLSPERWDDFLTRIFLRAAWREHLEKHGGKRLQAFQRKHKYLLMAYHPAIKDKMGRIAADREKDYSGYEKLVQKITSLPAERGKQANAALHVFGYFSQQMSEKARENFLERLELFRDGEIELTRIREILKQLLQDYPHSYIAEQSFLQPYPRRLSLIKTEQSSRQEDNGDGQDNFDPPVPPANSQG